MSRRLYWGLAVPLYFGIVFGSFEGPSQGPFARTAVRFYCFGEEWSSPHASTFFTKPTTMLCSSCPISLWELSSLYADAISRLPWSGGLERRLRLRH